MSTQRTPATRWLNTQERYGVLSIAMHWLMALLLVAVYTTMEFEDALPGGEKAVEAWHYALGLSVLFLVAARLAVRLLGPAPQIHPEPPAWQRLLARLTHLALYLFMIAMPLLGWVAMSGEGEAVWLSGMGWRIPMIPNVGESLGETAGELHEAVAVVGYGLIGLHTIAALAHHYWLRDDTLRRMLPGRSGAPRALPANIQRRFP